MQKLGEELVEHVLLYNHNPYENLVSVGTDRFGNEVLVNREFMRCDVRIGVGSVSPHPMNGFGGGGKLDLPGLAGIRTTYANHSRREFRPFSPEPCGLRRDIEAMTGMVMPFFKIDAVLNSRLEIVELRAGEHRQEHRQAVALSQALNGMRRAEGARDVVFVNANAKYNEALIAIRVAAMDLKPGGDIVLINHCPAGQVVHYLYSAFGSDYGGGCWQPYDKRPRSEIRRDHLLHPLPGRGQPDGPERAGQGGIRKDMGSGDVPAGDARPGGTGLRHLRRDDLLFSVVLTQIAQTNDFK